MRATPGGAQQVLGSVHGRAPSVADGCGAPANVVFLGATLVRRRCARRGALDQRRRFTALPGVGRKARTVNADHSMAPQIDAMVERGLLTAAEAEIIRRATRCARPSWAIR